MCYLREPSTGPNEAVQKNTDFQITQALAKNKESEALEKKTVAFEAKHASSCGLDVHKDKIEACVITLDGERHQKTFDTMRKTLYTLRDWILSFTCLNVPMESTSVYCAHRQCV